MMVLVALANHKMSVGMIVNAGLPLLVTFCDDLLLKRYYPSSTGGLLLLAHENQQWLLWQ